MANTSQPYAYGHLDALQTVDYDWNALRASLMKANVFTITPAPFDWFKPARTKGGYNKLVVKSFESADFMRNGMRCRAVVRFVDVSGDYNYTQDGKLCTTHRSSGHHESDLENFVPVPPKSAELIAHEARGVVLDGITEKAYATYRAAVEAKTEHLIQRPKA